MSGLQIEYVVVVVVVVVVVLVLVDRMFGFIFCSFNIIQFSVPASFRFYPYSNLKGVILMYVIREYCLSYAA